MDDAWTNILDFLDFKGKYLFLSPVCRRWQKLAKTSHTSHTNMAEMMASPSTIKEAGQHREGKKTLVKRNAWSFLAAKKTYDSSNTLPKLANQLKHTIEWDPFSVNAAARHNNLDFFRWLRTTSLEWDPQLALAVGSKTSSSSLPFLQSMLHLGYFPDNRSSTGAALVGSAEILRWLRHVGCNMDQVVQVLAEEGHIQTLRWAISIGIPYDHHALNAAAAYGGKLQNVQCIRTKLIRDLNEPS